MGRAAEGQENLLKILKTPGRGVLRIPEMPQPRGLGEY
jgi:hypothetical protein